MTSKSFYLPADLQEYLLAHSSGADQILRDLATETAALGDIARMQVAPEQGTLLTILCAALRPRLAVEIGTFTGFSALCLARGLPPGGRLVCFDRSEEWTAIARRHWERAGLADRIELRLGPAADTLPSLAADGPVDLAFLDADKTGYRSYYETLLPYLRRDGLLLVDNVLQRGQVLDPAARDENSVAVRAFNDAVARDERVQVVMLPIADGMSMLRKR